MNDDLSGKSSAVSDEPLAEEAVKLDSGSSKVDKEEDDQDSNLQDLASNEPDDELTSRAEPQRLSSSPDESRSSRILDGKFHRDLQPPDSSSYYLQVVKTGEQPEWPRPKEELDIYSQPLNESYIQYYAYPKSAGKTTEDLPQAEEVASKNKADNPVIIIDQIKDHLDTGECLELILAKDGHAWAKNESNLENLEDNISALLEIGSSNFEFKAEHFITTNKVSPEVEKRLSDLEEAEDKEDRSEPVFRNIPDVPAPESQKVPDVPEKSIDQNNPYFTAKSSAGGGAKSNKLIIIVPVILLIALFGAVIVYREQIMAKIGGKFNPPKQEVAAPTPVPTETPAPTPTVDRAIYKIRVLNGTPTTGAAGKLADKLKELSWQIDKTGNATNSAVAVSYIRIKKGVPDEVMSTLISDVTDYEAASSSATLATSDKADLEFVIGKK